MASNINGRYNRNMPQKIKLLLFFIFTALLILAYFLLFHKKIFAPQTITIKNYDDTAEILDSPPVGGLSATDTTVDSNIVSPPEKTPEKPIITNKPAEAEKKVASYKLRVTSKLVSWGFSSASKRKIDTVIIHSSYNALGGDVYDVNKLIQEYKEYGVAPHYLIDRKGKIYLLVEEKNIAYHAGESKTPDGRSQVNNFSLGIEMINTKKDNYTGEQYDSLKELLSKLKSDYSIKYVLGHNDIAPERKTDPWNFEWKKVK